MSAALGDKISDEVADAFKKIKFSNSANAALICAYFSCDRSLQDLQDCSVAVNAHSHAACSES